MDLKIMYRKEIQSYLTQLKNKFKVISSERVI